MCSAAPASPAVEPTGNCNSGRADRWPLLLLSWDLGFLDTDNLNKPITYKRHCTGPCQVHTLLFPNFGLIRPINITTRSRTFSQLSTVEVERDADASNKLQIPNISRCHVALSGHNGKMYQFHRSRPPVLAAAVSHHRVMMALGNYCCLQLVKECEDLTDWTLNKAATGNSTQFRNELMC